MTYVTDSERAAEMATNFATGSRPAAAKMGDAHFDSAGKDLLAGLLLAAAVGGEPIERVHYWLTRSPDDTRKPKTSTTSAARQPSPQNHRRARGPDHEPRPSSRTH